MSSAEVRQDPTGSSKEKGPAGGIGKNVRREDDSNMTSPAPGCSACATGLLIKGPGAANASSQTSHSLGSEVTAKPAGLRCAYEQLSLGMAKEQQREGEEGGGDSPGEESRTCVSGGHKHPQV